MYREVHVGIGGHQSLEGLPNLSGVGYSNGITDIEAADTQIIQFSYKVHQSGNRHPALKGAAEGGGHIQVDVQLREGIHDALKFVKGLFVGAAHVVLVVADAQGDNR